MKYSIGILGGLFLTTAIFGQATPSINHQSEPGTNNNDQLALGPSPGESLTMDARHYIGEYYGGGIVFYVDEEGKHGLITTTIDKSTRKQQRSEDFIHTNAVRDGITTGSFNANRLNAMKGTGENTAQVADNYQGTKLSDWYLPTRYDLIKLYRNRAEIGGYSDFAKGWKSTEFSSVNEWYQSFVTGGEFSNGKDDAVYIRVIRKF